MVRGKKLGAFYWIEEVDKIFNVFKKLFITIFILRMFDPLFRTRLETDISRFIIEIVISQLFYDLIYKRNDWHPIAF
jgi:hypothetical protein